MTSKASGISVQQRLSENGLINWPNDYGPNDYVT
jgi:hypothetical protein